MSCKKNGVYVHFGASTDEWTSHVNADLWECRKCGDRIMHGWGRGYSYPITMEENVETMHKYKIPTIFVYDKVEFYMPETWVEK